MGEVTPRMLSARLKELVAEGLVARRVDASTVPMRSEYSLTEAGREFIGVIQSLKRWALRWRPGNAACASADCAACEL
jgi:DNA-binding HxlR family transcriptional regulator